ncbi:MAG: sugar phosphate isomerase/epimerase [Bryobacterales bacterium]|nr:sugar phosphate isomerase/epimerase [Bryobacterales bacterium]
MAPVPRYYGQVLTSCSRRSFAQHLAAGAAALGMAAPTALAGRPIQRSRISAITDEIARSPEQAIEFCRQYELKWVELRGFPVKDGSRSREYFRLPEADLKQAAREFADAGLGVSFLNTSLLKYWLPGTTPSNPRARQDPTRFEKLREEFKQAAQAAHILGTDKVRIFTFWRVADPAAVMPRVAEIIDELGALAAKEKLRLLIENEGACNVGSAAELASLLKLVKSKAVGINWDPLNAEHSKEIAFPDGYAMLPANRIWNVQIKGHSILPGKEWMDWAAIFKRLERDGYRGQVGLETHIFGEVQIQRSHESMREILRLVQS